MGVRSTPLGHLNAAQLDALIAPAHSVFNEESRWIIQSMTNPILGAVAIPPSAEIPLSTCTKIHHFSATVKFPPLARGTGYTAVHKVYKQLRPPFSFRTPILAIQTR